MVNNLKGGHMANRLEGMERLVREREKALLGYAYVVCGDPTSPKTSSKTLSSRRSRGPARG